METIHIHFFYVLKKKDSERMNKFTLFECSKKEIIEKKLKKKKINKQNRFFHAIKKISPLLID